MRRARRRLTQVIGVAAVLLTFFLSARAQTSAAGIDPELREMAVISYFVEKHLWLMDTGLITDAQNQYGISGLENAAMTGVVRSLKRELDALQAEAPNYQKENRGREYFERRKGILLFARSRLQQIVGSPGWQKLQSHLDEIGARLRGTPVATPESEKAEASRAGVVSTTMMWSTLEMTFYPGGLGGRSDSWPEGPDAADICSYVDGVKGLRDSTVFDGPRSASSCGGGRAWAGWTRESPPRGTYKHEGKHSFWDGRTRQSWPPFPTWPPAGSCVVLGSPAPFDSYCDPSNGYAAIWSPVDLTLNVAAPMEVNKPGHHVILKNCSSPVAVTAAFVPPVASYTTPPTITWTGGTAGPDNLHRNVPCTSSGLTSVTASVGANLSATVHVHVIDGGPPPASSQATLTWQNIGSFISERFGHAAVSIGDQGVTAPTYDVTAGFSTDRWVFHLNSVTHGYKIGLNSNNRYNLPYGNPRPFPISSLLPGGTSIVQAHSAARADLDTSALVPATSFVGGPLMNYYWVQSVVQSHEQAHVEHFYQPQFQFWDRHMRDFETNDVEGPSAAVIYNCSDPNTTSGAAATAYRRSGWDAAIAAKHTAADDLERPSAEHYAYSTTNPNFVPIWSAIPTGGAPVISGIRPASATPGSSGHIEIYGQELHYNPIVSLGGTGVTTWPMYVSPTQLNVGYSVDAAAPIGPRWLSVETDNGTAGDLFSIARSTPVPPHINGIDPTAAARGSSGYIAIYGDHLIDGYGVVSVSGSGVSVTNVYESTLQINVSYTISANAAPGPRTLTVTTSAGVSNGVSFTVQ